jgi:Peptidase inhibitor family I36
MVRRTIATLLLMCPILFDIGLQAQRRDRAGDEWTYNGNYSWDPSWNKRPYPRSGACFFKEAGYSGDHFCLRQGDRLDHLPGNFGDNISSVKLFGRARVVVFNDRHFSGGSQQFDISVQDLRNRRFEDGHTWNNRISSMLVRQR